MTAFSSFPSKCFAVIALGVLSLASGCNERDVPRTQSGEPVPFDHLATPPGDHPPMPAAAGQTQPAANTTARSIKVTVKLSSALVGKAAPGDTVFIFARAAQGPKMPLAIVRKQVKDLPVTVTLDDSLAMVPNMNISSFPQLVIGARVSKSGNAVSQSGDLEGYAPPLKSVSVTSVEVVIASVVGGAAAASMPAHAATESAPGADFQHAKSGHKSRLNIPADVQAKWKSVELALSGKNISPHNVHVPIGGETQIDQSGLLLRVVAYVPAFISDNGTVSSASNNPDNPAVLVQLVDKGQVQSEGWLFQNLPDFNTYSSNRLQVKLVTASTSEGS
jgi:hypothetical protein